MKSKQLCWQGVFRQSGRHGAGTLHPTSNRLGATRWASAPDTSSRPEAPSQASLAMRGLDCVLPGLLGAVGTHLYCLFHTPLFSLGSFLAAD